MHIPDGFLDLKTAATTAALSASGVTLALRKLKTGLPRRKIPLMGLAAAFVFVAQMLNFPVAGGTSGHLLGAVLAAVLLGPSAAMVVMTAVLLVQCLLFADGGVVVLGANLFNMAVLGVLGGYAVFYGVHRLIPNRRGLLVATAFASWCSTMLAAIACAGELAWSGVAPWRIVFPAMATTHLLIGVGEGVITTLVILAVERTRPDLVAIALRKDGPAGYGWVAAYGLVITVGLLLFVAPFASPLPDGLEHVAESLGFADAAVTPIVATPFADYDLPLVGSAVMATWIAGLVGAVVVFALAHLLAVCLIPRSTNTPRPATGA